MKDVREILTPEQTVRKSEIIAKKIKALISENKFQAGEKLPSENDLAKMLSVSRPSVREALRSLELMGFIEVKSGSGSYVRDLFSGSFPNHRILLEEETFSMMELLEARKLFEINVVSELAAKNCLPDDLHELERIVSDFEASLDDETALKNADMNFHCEMARLTKNQIIENIANSFYSLIKEKLPRTYLIICTNPKLGMRLVKLHRRVVDALRAGDVRKTKRAMTQHDEIAYEISKNYFEYLRKAKATRSKNRLIGLFS